ncbi:hybrid sensor histidine kinase/response regulator [Phaeacidiphilus oryzae]|uniref:hybrid sensor histidine kinase/response regulator n=1 Tax=Phaeacidiphilus oryzae TaxID=348818 RepID=UPI000559FEAF|nr:PAS domain-containing protein [Phaeacidiphilus oryzae]
MSSPPTRGAARLAAILDALPDALLLVNSNGTVIDANRAAKRDLQSPGTALVGRGVLDLLPELDPTLIPGSMRPRAARSDDGGGAAEEPVRMTARRTDGSGYPVEITANDFEDDSGGGYGSGGYDPFGGSGYGSSSGRPEPLLLLAVRDLSTRLDTEAELRRQHKQTEMILRAASEGVVGVDTEGRVVLVNPAAAHILGYRASELGGQELRPLVLHSRADGTPVPDEESALVDTLRSGRKHRVRSSVLWRKDGRAVPVELSTAPVRDGEQMVGAVMTFTDRSASLALTARHEHLTAVLEEELRGPLESLRARLDTLANDPAGQLWPEANWMLHTLAAECSRFSRLVEGVLSYQRFEASAESGREGLAIEAVSLEKLLGRAVEAATELTGPGRIRFVVHPSAVEVAVDAERLAAALGHLIVDAAVARGASGAEIQPQGVDVVIAAAQRGDVVRIEVRGPAAGGSDVHLPIARGTVERHGGVLQAHRLPGKDGVTYVVELPLDSEAVAAAQQRAAAAAQARASAAPKENETALLPELPELPTAQPAADGGPVGDTEAGEGSAAVPAARRSEESLGGGGVPGAGDGVRPGEQEDPSAAGTGEDRSQRRSLPAPEVVRPPRPRGHRRKPNPEEEAAEDPLGGLLGQPAYPGLEQSLAQSPPEPPTPPTPSQGTPTGRRRRLGLPPGAGAGGGNARVQQQPGDGGEPGPGHDPDRPGGPSEAEAAALEPARMNGAAEGRGRSPRALPALPPATSARASAETDPDQAEEIPEHATETPAARSGEASVTGAFEDLVGELGDLAAIDPDGPIRPRRLLVWPEPDVSTRQALVERGYRPVTVRSREEVDAQVADFPAALFVDPLTGPITRTALQSLRTAAVAANVPVLVTAGLGQATREAAYGADPAVLLRALAPRDSEQHAPRVLLVEQDPDIAAAFTATLERRGMQVAHAASENDAVTQAAQLQPNLVVMDLMLVRRRRVGIIDWLRTNQRLARTPLVVYTSVDMDAEELPRLRGGETVLFLAERSTSPDVQGRIVDLLGKMGAVQQ